MKVTITNDDGSTVDLFDQAYTDAAVVAATAVPAPVADVEIDIKHSDGTETKFTPEA